MTFRGYLLFAAGAALVLLMAATRPRGLSSADDAPAAPAFTHARAEDWINSAPLSWGDLGGQVVLVEFWTFACWNCYRSIPWLQTLEPKFGPRGFRTVSVHTPEFDHERIRSNVEKKVREHRIAFPVMLDNDFSYWNALGNRYWPAFYLVDRRGRVRAFFAGETHAGDANAGAIESAIQTLLSEDALGHGASKS